MKFFVALMSVFALNLSAQAQTYSSSSSCYAYTDCYDNYGRYIGQISCQVYGSQYVYGAGAASNSCQWSTIPYVSVHCSGYQQVVNPYTGQYAWQWQTYDLRCPGR